MRWFSYRKGLKKVRTQIQTESIDEALRNRLWNVLRTYFWKTRTEDSYPFLEVLWHSHLKRPTDRIVGRWREDYTQVRQYYFNCKWFEVYDFIEFIANNYPKEKTNSEFMEACNEVLESELSAYRFVGEKITQITSEEEISEIEEALETPLEPIKVHLGKALKLMSDRKSPDYRNSIKESISAVEAICRIISKNEKATLGQALKIVENKVGLHGALKKGFSSLYGYTSSADGIRHALGLLEEQNLSFEDAKFMLVSCSAFINYLISKASKAGIKIGE